MFIHANQPLIVGLAMSQRWSAIFCATGAWGLKWRKWCLHEKSHIKFCFLGSDSGVGPNLSQLNSHLTLLTFNSSTTKRIESGAYNDIQKYDAICAVQEWLQKRGKKLPATVFNIIKLLFKFEKLHFSLY